MSPGQKVRIVNGIAQQVVRDVFAETENAHDRRVLVELVVRRLIENHDRLERLVEGPG